MLSNEPTIIELLESHTYKYVAWKMHQDAAGQVQYCATFDTPGVVSAKTSVSYKAADVMQLLPDLVPVFDHLFQQYRERPWQLHAALFSTMAHWKRPGHWLQTTKKGGVRIRCINALSTASPGQSMNASVISYMTHALPMYHASKARVADTAVHATVLLPFVWLEHHYPGAVERISTAQGLGLTPEEVAAYACQVDEAAYQPAVLPELVLGE